MNNSTSPECRKGAHELVLHIQERLDGFDTSSFSPELCIYRTPANVYRFNKAAYDSRLVSLGVYSSYNTELMGQIKISYCTKLIERGNKNLNDIVKHFEECKSRVSCCYEEGIKRFSDPKKVVEIVISCCFIVEHMIRLHCTELRDSSGNIPFMHNQTSHIKRDMLILANQVPYFFLESLFNLVEPFSLSTRKERCPNFNDLVMSFLEEYHKCDVLPDFRSVKHFTDLVRTLHEPKRQIPDPRYPDFEFTTSATQLYNAGVEFKVASGKCLLDVDFNHNCLILPCFELNEDQESLYRNLMALELCQYANDTFIIDYFVFMDTLINTSNDVSLLVQAGVLVNRIGDYQDAANTFNKFCAGITNYRATNSYLNPVYGKLNAYYKKPKNTWMTTFKRDYFGSPFRTASTIAAVSLVGLTLISTVCSIISVA